MDFVQILILSIIQGITEFLPISSQSHLILASTLLGMSDQGLSFDVALHAGSLMAILIYYRKEITKIISISDEGIQFFKLIMCHDVIDADNSEKVAALKEILSTSKRNFNRQKKRIDKYYKEQMEDMASIEPSMQQIFSIISLK